MAEVSPAFLIPTLFPKPSKKTLERLKETLSPNSKFLKFTMIGFAIPCGRGLFPLEETQWLTLKIRPIFPKVLTAAGGSHPPDLILNGHGDREASSPLPLTHVHPLAPRDYPPRARRAGARVSSLRGEKDRQET